MQPASLPPLDALVMERVAPYFSQFPEFCGHQITAFCQQRGLSAEQVAAALGTPLPTLQHLACVLAPRTGPRWAADVRTLAEWYGIDAGKLALLLRP